MFVLLMIICVVAAGCSVSASNSTGRFGLINIVTEQYSILKDGASKMNALVKAVNEEFAGGADKNRHVQISLYLSSTTGLTKEFLRKRSNDNRTLPLTTADTSQIGLLNRHQVIKGLRANLDNADNELMWKTHSAVHSDTLNIETSKSILLFVMHDGPTRFNFEGQDNDIHGLMAQLIVMVYQPAHDPIQDFKEPASAPPRNRRNLGDPLAHYLYTEDNVDQMANDIDRELTVTQQDCVPNISYKCGERGIGSTSVECLYLKDIGANSQKPKCLNRARCTSEGGCPQSLVCDANGFCSAPPANNDKVKSTNVVQVHLQTGSEVETRTLKPLTFRNHQLNMGFKLRSIGDLKSVVRLIPKVRLSMPLIFGSSLDRASEYIMDNITIRIGQDPVVWELLERFKYQKWPVEFQIVYSCKRCPKNKYAVIVVLAKVSKKGQIDFSPDQLIPHDRERYLLFKVPMDPKMEQAIEGKTDWFIINQWLTIAKSDKETV